MAKFLMTAAMLFLAATGWSGWFVIPFAGTALWLAKVSHKNNVGLAQTGHNLVFAVAVTILVVFVTAYGVFKLLLIGASVLIVAYHFLTSPLCMLHARKTGTVLVNFGRIVGITYRSAP